MSELNGFTGLVAHRQGDLSVLIDQARLFRRLDHRYADPVLDAVRRMVAHKGEVGLCRTCMDARGMAQTEMIEGATRSTLAQLADWTAAADKVLVF